MGVRINTSKTFKTQVEFTLMSADGKKEKQSFEAEFKRLTREETKVLLESGKTDAEMLQDVMIGWRLQDADSKEDVPFTEETLAAYTSIAGAAGVAMLTFLETVGASRAKN